jgi:hypothetical protein
MNRLRTIVIALALLGLMAPLAAEAKSGSRVGNYCAASGWKLAHGLLSIPYSAVDLVTTPVSMAIDWDSDGRSLVGFSLGLTLGVVNAASRLEVGLAEVITFPFVSTYSPRPFKFEPHAFGWSPIMGNSSKFPSQTIDASPIPRRHSAPSGD